MIICVCFCTLHARLTPKHNNKLRSKSLEEDKKDRRISWGTNGEEDEEEKRKVGEKRCFSDELKCRRHTVAGDTTEFRYP